MDPFEGKSERVIFCDIGNVLLFFDLFKSINRFLARGTKSSREVLPIIFEFSFLADLELGKVTPKEFHKKASKVFGMKIPFQEFCEIWTDIFQENRPMTRWIKEMSARHRIYILSNTNQLHYDFVKTRYDMFHSVHGAVISHEVGLRKPDPRFFCLALKMADIPARNVFYLDDVWEHVHGARRVGIHAQRFIDFAIAMEDWKRFLAESEKMPCI